ncbi:MAG: ABC-F family ATP-binding cassette domain-containing protein [Candidatus Hydrogenedentes bacterium]|nr:ABC-F family ATP-binding cassette domain-containing protein [Candidatus Hydrogenedentota bacterium]
MSVIRLDNVSKSFGGKPILKGVSVRVEEGEKIGLIGRNGTGKSTLFRLMTGEVEPDSGLIERMRRARTACLAQLPSLRSQDTIFDVVMHSFHELVELELQLGELEGRMASGDETALDRYSVLQDEFTVRGGYTFRSHAKQVLHGLGFTVSDFDLHVGALSGGQRTRLMLALVLLQDADLLLLDEPENHLDLEAREWLEDFLKGWPRTFVIISHDRQMLNAVTERIIEVERGETFEFTGNYEAYQKNKTLIREQQQKAYERQQEQIEKEESWINRFRYKATKATQVQSRIKRLEKLERVEAPLTEAGSATFKLGEVVRSGAVVLDVKDLSMAYGDLTLYEDVSFQVERGERVGIIGPNGTGKTTLLRQISGRLSVGAGAVALGHKVKLGYYEQHHEALNSAGDILGEVSAVRPDMTPEQVRRFLGRFLFTGDDVFKPITALSGGELSRVAMAKLILGGSNLLLLDEPTNHLDIASREALEGALEEFPGSLLIVSHDRALIDRLVEKLIIIQHGVASVHLGNYSHYRWKQGPAAKGEEARQSTTEDVLKIRKKKPQLAKQDEKVRRKQRKELEEIERTIESLEQHLESLEIQFTKIDPADYQQAQDLKSEYDGMKADLAELYSEWERLSEGMAESG